MGFAVAYGVDFSFNPLYRRVFLWGMLVTFVGVLAYRGDYGLLLAATIVNVANSWLFVHYTNPKRRVESLEDVK